MAHRSNTRIFASLRFGVWGVGWIQFRDVPLYSAGPSQLTSLPLSHFQLPAMPTASLDETDNPWSSLARGLFGFAGKHVLVGIVVGLVLLLVSYPFLPWQLSPGVLGGVSLAALAPGWAAGRMLASQWRKKVVAVGSEPPHGRSPAKCREALVLLVLWGGMIAMAIRSVGAIALVAGCRYQFAETAQQIAFLVIGWYVVLTSIEVRGLVREARRLDGAPRTAKTETKLDEVDPAHLSYTPNSSTMG